MNCKLESTIWSRGTGQRLPCFDRCQLTTTWMSNIKDVRCKPGLGISWSMAVVLCDVVVIGRTRSQSVPLAMLTMKEELHRFLFLCMHVVLWAHALTIRAISHVDHERRVARVSISMHACCSFSIVMVLRLVALWVAGAPL